MRCCSILPSNWPHTNCRPGRTSAKIAAANQLVMLTQRIAKNVAALRIGDAISPEIAFQLGKDTNTFREFLTAFAKGSEELRISPAADGETRRVVGELETAFKDYQGAVGDAILSGMQELVFAKQAGARIFVDNEALLDAADLHWPVPIRRALPSGRSTWCRWLSSSFSRWQYCP